MKMKLILFVLTCCILQTCLQAAVVNTDKTSIKSTGIDPASIVTIGNKTYYIGPAAVTVTALEATQLCNGDGGRLLSLETKEKRDLIYDFLRENGFSFANYWLSGRKWGNVYQWTGSGKIFTYTDWNGEEPNETGDKPICTQFGVYSGWFDLPCHLEYQFMCEF